MAPTTNKTRRTPAAWGSIERLPSARYRAYYKHNDRRVSAPRTFETKHAASAWLAAEQTAHVTGAWIDPAHGDTLLGDYATRWLDSRGDLAERTQDNYRRLLTRWILPPQGDRLRIELGAYPLAKITPATVREWHAAVIVAARSAAGAHRRRGNPGGRRRHPARAWAAEHGIELPPTGRIRPAVLGAWEAAGSPIPAPAVVPDPDGDTRAGQTTAAHAYALLRSIMNTAVSDGLLAASPCKIKGAASSYHPERPTATLGEVQAITERMPDRYATAVILAVGASLRFGEVFGLQRRDIDAATGILRVRRALIEVSGKPARLGTTKTTTSNRDIRVPAFALAPLLDHLDRFTGSEPTAQVFTTRSGRLLTSSTFNRFYRRAADAVGRPDLRFHDLRHTGATMVASGGASIADIRARLGHATSRAALIYVHAAHNAGDLIADRLDAMWNAERAPEILPLPTRRRRHDRVS